MLVQRGALDGGRRHSYVLPGAGVAGEQRHPSSGGVLSVGGQRDDRGGRLERARASRAAYVGGDVQVDVSGRVDEWRGVDVALTVVVAAAERHGARAATAAAGRSQV